MRCREVKMYYSERGQYNPPVIAVLERFKRLRWGAFIHARPGRKKHLYRKPERLREKLQEHILTNRATSFMLDNMLNKDWRRPQYYPEDIYEPYHQRTGVPWDYGLHKRKFFP
ncbi:Ribosomal protein L35 mitochondrial [Fasciolopsis buskii]|uniref:Ribosomal protein L35 mitochondrial n=1 Tax=Fasciolopsis buskii TaxID=27845 RepID=A0A8E0RWA7_9TREM|nr:Ribosomal protein L35 mitochondrial [Fasciolopsis buski]